MSVIAYFLTDLEIREILAQRLRQRRLERNLMVDDLAVHAGVNRKTILALESGKDIRLSSLIKILRSLDMLGLIEAAIPDSLPGSAALVRGGRPRTSAGRGSRGGPRPDDVRGVLAPLPMVISLIIAIDILGLRAGFGR